VAIVLDRERAWRVVDLLQRERQAGRRRRTCNGLSDGDDERENTENPSHANTNGLSSVSFKVFS
jgi:hypothetical protein